MAGDITEMYVCGRCFSVDTAAGICPRCGLPRRHCNLGQPGDPCRRPPMDADGRILSRAPQWWVLPTLQCLREAAGRQAHD
jgi:hypothetical protein